MLALRLTHDRGSTDVRLERASISLGASPTADVTLQGVSWPDEALRIEVQGEAVTAHVPGRPPQALVAGESLQVGAVVVQLLAASSPAVAAPAFFGGYEDDLPGAGRQATFELMPAGDPAAGAPPVSGTPEWGRSIPSRSAPTGAHPMRARPAAAHTAPTAAAVEARPGGALAPPPGPSDPAPPLSPTAFPDPDFGMALVAGLRRAPFWAISLGIHALIFVVLSLLLDQLPDDPAAGPPAMAAMVDAGDQVRDESSHEEHHAEEQEQPRLSAQQPDPLPADFDPTPTPPQPETQTPWVDRLPDVVAEQDTPLDIGLMPSLASASRKPKPARPIAPLADLTRSFGTAGATQGNQEAARLVRDMLVRGGRQGKGSRLTDIGSRDILVVQGSFDHIERVLDLLALPYERRAPWTLAQEGGDNFDAHKIVFWNCSENMLPAKRLDQVARSLRRFVSKGGYLFTTDWCIATVIEPAFPGYMQTKGRDGRLPEMVLDIQPARHAEGHPLLEGVFLPRTQGQWWLEQASFDVVVAKPDDVTVLMEAPALHDIYKRSSVIAATFNFGRGRVLHSVGHYFQEQGNVAGTVAAHRLALNFVLMKLDQDKE